jgi:DNA topoisomerase-1
MRNTAPRQHRNLKVASQLGLRVVAIDELTIARKGRAGGFIFTHANKKPIRDAGVLKRLNRLAVPPAYANALYCPDPRGHIQAIWRDKAGRLQYRYHPDWETGREARRAKQLARLSRALPRIRRAIGRRLSHDESTREFAVAAIIDLVAKTGIRAGRESYARVNGTYGAATLLKSQVRIKGDHIVLAFRAKGGQDMRKAIHDRRLAAALRKLRTLPGLRLFQYRENGQVKPVRAREVNEYLRAATNTEITLKDFRTLAASAAVLETLGRIKPASRERLRKKQIADAMRAAAEKLGNTPAVCRKSYVPACLVEAFENGGLTKSDRSGSDASIMAKIVASQSA